MDDVADVVAAARRRADALARRDSIELKELLHPLFVWTSHRGERFDLDAYLESNTSGVVRWSAQRLRDPDVIVVGHTAVLMCTVEDEVDLGSGRWETFVMPMTQTWVREHGRWMCLAGHAGPRLKAVDE